jgi:hypothetical protein
MRKAIAAAACAVLAILPGSALANSRAKIYRGTFQAVGADGAYTNGKFGKAQLVDGKRNDKLSVHVRHLGGRSRYVFRLMQAPNACEQRAPGGAEAPGWRYRRDGVLKTTRKGNANSWARSKSFKAQSGVEYFVGVFTATPAGDPGELVLCAELRRKGAKRGKHTPAKHGHKPGKRSHKPKHRAKPDKPVKPDKPAKPADPGKSGDQHGGGKPHPHSILVYRSRLLR